MEKENILNELDLIFERINNIGFMGTNEYELHLKDEIADWVITLLPQENVIKSVCERCLKEKELKVCNECYCSSGFE